jgi:hypothetical protein
VTPKTAVTPPTVPGNTYYYKENIGQDVQDKIKYLQDVCYDKGMNDMQVLWTVAMADHESAGTWSPTIKGDGGCSTGIGQWNSCPGSQRKAADTFEGQAEQLCREMKDKYDRFNLKTAVGKHNAPAWDSNPNYVARVQGSIKNFRTIK